VHSLVSDIDASPPASISACFQLQVRDRTRREASGRFFSLGEMSEEEPQPRYSPSLPGSHLPPYHGCRRHRIASMAFAGFIPVLSEFSVSDDSLFLPLSTMGLSRACLHFPRVFLSALLRSHVFAFAATTLQPRVTDLALPRSPSNVMRLCWTFSRVFAPSSSVEQLK
jgi:hypothetical protein